MYLTSFDFNNGNGEKIKETGWALFLQVHKLPNGTIITDNMLLVVVNLAYGITVLALSYIFVIIIYKILINFK